VCLMTEKREEVFFFLKKANELGNGILIHKWVKSGIMRQDNFVVLLAIGFILALVIEDLLLILLQLEKTL
jgi:hypothetical protein